MFFLFFFHTVRGCEGDHSECLYAECIIITFFPFNSAFLFCFSQMMEPKKLPKTVLLNVNVLNCVPSVAALAQVSV